MVIELLLESNGVYGYRRVAHASGETDPNARAGERIVKRIMREEDLRAKQSKKNPCSSCRGTEGKVASPVEYRKAYLKAAS